VKYVTVPRWQSSIKSVSGFDEPPDACKGYIKFIERIRMVGGYISHATMPTVENDVTVIWL
jgi:adenylosuccinate synthase